MERTSPPNQFSLTVTSLVHFKPGGRITKENLFERLSIVQRLVTPLSPGAHLSCVIISFCCCCCCFAFWLFGWVAFDGPLVCVFFLECGKHSHCGHAQASLLEARSRPSHPASAAPHPLAGPLIELKKQAICAGCHLPPYQSLGCTQCHGCPS